LGKFDGKVVIVTGSGRGIGKAIALAFAREGANVVVNVSRSVEEGQKVVDEIKAMGREAILVQANVAKIEEVEKMVKITLEKFGKIDILVNNAGINRPAMVYKMKKEEWDEVIDVNLKGVFNCIRLVAPHMIERKQGKIINVSSTAAEHGLIGNSNYAASKAGVNALTKTAALELARYGINVNAVEPFIIETRFTEWVKDPRFKDKYLSRIPLGRFGKPEDVAGAVLFLASDEASYITGKTIEIDGGAYI